MRGDGRPAACCFLYACGFAGRPQTAHASPAGRRPPAFRQQAADRPCLASKPQTACVSPASRRPPAFRQQAADGPCFADGPQTAFCEGCSLLRNFRLRLMGVPPIFLQEKEQPLPNKFVEAVLSL